MKYSIQPRDKTFALTMSKNLSSKYSQKRLHTAKKPTADAIKTASKGAIQKIAEGTGILVGNKIADKVTSVSKKSSQNASKELHSKADEIEIPKERYKYLEKRQQIIDELILV